MRGDIRVVGTPKEDNDEAVGRGLKGVYPQNYGSLAIVDIDASKGFIDLWVHFFVAIEEKMEKFSTKFKHV